MDQEKFEQEFKELLYKTAQLKKQLIEEEKHSGIHDAKMQEAEGLQKVGATGDLDLIMDIEHEYIKVNLVDPKAQHEERQEFLKEGLIEMQNALKGVDYVRIKEKYAIIADCFNLPKNRKNGLPFDETRQFFKEQTKRLKFDLDHSTREGDTAILEARISNLKIAEKLYIELQKKALEPEKKKGMGLEM